MNETTATRATAVTPPGAERLIITGYIDWTSVLAGTVIAATMSILLLTFGSAVGLSVASPWTSDVSAETVGFGAALWFTLVQIYAAAAGAYFAARLRPVTGDGADRDEINFRDGANGLVVWALSFMLSFALLYSTAASIVQGTAAATSATTSAVTSAMGNASAFAIDRAAEGLLAAQTTGNEPAVTGQTAGQPATPPGTAATGAGTGADLAQISDEARAQMRRAVMSIATTGEIDEQTRTYLRNLVVRTTGVTPAEATERVNQYAQAAITEVREVTEAARRSTAAAAFWMAFAMLVAGIAAWFSGEWGGDHRDRATPRIDLRERIRSGTQRLRPTPSDRT